MTREYERIAWDDQDCEDFGKLERLLIECESINSANNIIPRLERLIELAKELNHHRLGRRRLSFLKRLEDDALAVRSKLPREAKSDA